MPSGGNGRTRGCSGPQHKIKPAAPASNGIDFFAGCNSFVWEDGNFDVATITLFDVTGDSFDVRCPASIDPLQADVRFGYRRDENASAFSGSYVASVIASAPGLNVHSYVS